MKGTFRGGIGNSSGFYITVLLWITSLSAGDFGSLVEDCRSLDRYYYRNCLCEEVFCKELSKLLAEDPIKKRVI